MIDKKIFENFVLYELSGDKKIFDSLLAIFFEQIIDLVRTSIHDLAAITRAAHKVKSSAQSFGAIQFAQVLIQIEAAAKAGKVDSVEKLTKEVKEQEAILRAELFELKDKVFKPSGLV